jgi:hypothetical protein
VIDSDEDITVSSYELYELSNCSLLKNHVALMVVGKLVGEIFDVALTSLLPAVGMAFEPGFICQPDPLPGIKTRSSPAAFPTTLSLSPLSPLSLSLSLLFPPTFLHPPSCLRPRQAPLTPLLGSLVHTEPTRRGQWEICRSATADSYSLDASAALSRRPFDLTVTPMKRPGRSSSPPAT